MIQGARGWCTGMTQRDGMGRVVGAGIGMGNTCKPMAVSFQCMTKSTTIKKKKRRTVKKIKNAVYIFLFFFLVQPRNRHKTCYAKWSTCYFFSFSFFFFFAISSHLSWLPWWLNSKESTCNALQEKWV